MNATKEKIDELKKYLMDNTTYDVDYQSDDQVAVWCESFGKMWNICFQNGDMSGGSKGEAVWDNPGADFGIDELRDILKSRPEWQCLVENSEHWWKYERLNDFIAEFVEELSEKEHIEEYIANMGTIGGRDD